MALRDQPYIPLYIQDVLTDEKLILCTSSSHGIYLRLLCILHKQEKYGEIRLKQKHKQNESKYDNFASLLVRQMPFIQKEIRDGLFELDEENVIQITNDTLRQKRMVRDGELSIIRSISGKKGGSNVTKQYGKPGCLYWIGNYSDKNKIGISINPQNRLYRLRSDLKIKDLEIQDSFKVKDMGKAEDNAHKHFGKLMDGEWVIIDHEEMKERFDLLKAKVKAKVKASTEDESEDTNKDKKKKYGEYENVLLTDKQFKDLKDKVDDRNKWINEIDLAIEEKGNIWHIKNFYLAAIKWYKKDLEKNPVKPKKRVINHYEYKCPNCSKMFHPREMKGDDDAFPYRCDENGCQTVGLGKDGKNMVGVQLEFVKNIYND